MLWSGNVYKSGNVYSSMLWSGLVRDRGSEGRENDVREKDVVPKLDQRLSYQRPNCFPIAILKVKSFHHDPV